LATLALKKQGVDGRVKHGHDGGERMGHWPRLFILVLGSSKRHWSRLKEVFCFAGGQPFFKKKALSLPF
jgi:hypothetical protein